MKKIIIDTDIGDDMDDAYALALACMMPEVEILGVVTVFKDVATRCKMAKMMLSLGGKGDVAVYRGMSRPLNQTVLYGKPIDFNAPLWSYNAACEAYDGNFGDGIDFYLRTLENAKEPVTIVTIGAMTNVGYVLKTRPDLTSKIEKIVIMGGAYETNHSEYNFSCDPEAAEIVMRSNVRKTAVGVDITFGCYLDARDLKAMRAMRHPLIKQLCSFVAPGQERVYLHDPLTLYYLADPSIFEFRKDVVHVETSGSYTRGVVAKMDNCNWCESSENSDFSYAIKCKTRDFIDEFMRRMNELEQHYKVSTVGKVS